MPIYNLNGDTYNIPDNVVDQFERENPNATVQYSADGSDYDIPVNKKDDFLKSFPSAQYRGLTVEEPKQDEYPQPTDAAGNPITNNGQPYSQAVLAAYNSPENKGDNFKDLATLASEMEGSVQQPAAATIPSDTTSVQSDTRTEEQRIADEEAARHNDEFWSNDPTLQARKRWNARNAVLLDPTIPRDQRSIFQKENRQNLLDISNPRYQQIIKHNDAVEKGMEAFDNAIADAEEKGRQSIMDALKDDGFNSLARTMSPNGDIMPDYNAIRSGNEKVDPQKVMDKIINDVTKNLMSEEYFTKDGKMLNESGQYVIQDLRQRMIQQLVDARVPKSTAEYVVLNAIKNSDIGKLTRMATNTAYENWLDDVAASNYDAGFWEKVANGALTFGMNLPEFLGTGVAGGAVSKKIIGEFTERTANELVKRGLQKATAERAAQMVVNNSLRGSAVKLGAASASGATTFGLQPIIGEPINITYQSGQPGPIEGTVNAPGLKDYLVGTAKEVGKGSAMGALMIGGAAAKTVEKIAEGSIKEGLARGAAGLAYDSSVMSYFGLMDRKEQDPDFEITPETAAESFAESAASLMLLKAPHLFSLKGKIKDAKEFNRKYNFTQEDRDVLKEMGIKNPLEMVEKLAYKGASPETISKSKENITLPSADGAESITAEEMQQLTNEYRSFMASEAPETLKAKAQYLIEGKMPATFSSPVDSRVIERNGKVYLETLNENGGVIESRKMKDLANAETERMKLNYDIDMNKTAAMERRLNEQEVVSDFASNLSQDYESARVKTLTGEELTREDRQAVYLYQNFDKLQAALERQAAGAELTPDEQALVDAMTGRTKAYVNRDNASRRVAEEVEQELGLHEGDVERAIRGHSKEEAESTGEQVFEVGNGTYRTNSEFNIVEKYREALLNRINANNANRNAEDVARAAEATQQQDNTPRIGARDIVQPSDGGEPPTPPTPPAGSAGGGFNDGVNNSQNDSQNGGQADSGSGDLPQDILTRREEAYNRGIAVTDDPTQLPGIAYDKQLATERMRSVFAGANPVTVQVVTKLMQAVDAGNDVEADRLMAEVAGSMSASQAEAIELYRDAVETERGVEDAITNQAESYEEQQRELLQLIAAPDGTITPLVMKDGSTLYYINGELENRWGGVNAADESGNVKQIPNSDISSVGESQSLNDILTQRVNDFAANLETEYREYTDGSRVKEGQLTDVMISGQPFSVTFAGTDASGNVILQMQDGSQIPMSPVDVQKAVLDARNLKVQQQLKQESDAERLADQQQRFAKGIIGYNEGQPDLTAAVTDPTVAAEYLMTQFASTENPEQSRKQYLADVQNTKEQLKRREEEIMAEKVRLTQWLKGNEDIADPAEVEQVNQRIDQIDVALDDIAVRGKKYGDIRRNLMTPEEVNQMEQQRGKEVFKARSGYQPQLPQRNFTTNEDRITLENGQPNFGLTPVGNTNNYLLRNFAESNGAEQFVNDQRIALRNKQRDEVQPQINNLKGILNAYTTGHIELTPDEVKRTTQQLADLEAYQDALSQEAVNLRKVAEGIPALYERNGREEELSPEEQRGQALDKAKSIEDKIRIAKEVYKDYPEALDIINDMEPRELDEFIASNLGPGSLNWEGFDQGERHIIGVQEAVFGKNGATRGIGKNYSTNAFNMYLAPTGEGRGFADVVHSIYEAQPDSGDGKQYTTEDISNGLIDLLRSAQKPSDISHRIIGNRIAEAEDIVQRQEEFDREMEEQAKLEEMQQWADAYHLNPEERADFEEFMKMPPTEMEQELINQIIAENEEQNTASKGVDQDNPSGEIIGNGQAGQVEIQGQGASGESGGDTEQQVVISGTEASAESPTVPDTDVSGGTSGINESFPARLAEAKAETDVNPTDAQKQAGNYKMGHIKFGGYSMSIENPKGSIRSGVDKSGKPWSIEMKDTYGYIGKKYGTDGDHLDFFINDDADLDSWNGRVFVVDQKNEDGSFDEHKVMYGYRNWSEARKAFERNYEPGWWDKHMMQMTGVKKADFDKWLSDSDHKTKPFAEYYRTRMADTVSDPSEQLMADIKDREAAAAKRSEEQRKRDAIIERLKEPMTKDNGYQHLVDAYTLGDKATIGDMVDSIRELMNQEIELDLPDFDGEEVYDYTGNDPEKLAQEYIERLYQHIYLDYDDDIPYIVTGIKSPEGRAKVPASIRYDVDDFLTNDRKLGKGKLTGDELRNAMQNQKELAAKMQPLLKKLTDEGLQQTLEALKDFEDSTPVNAVLMKQERRADLKDAMDEVMAEIEKRQAANPTITLPSIGEDEMQYMDDEQLMQQRRKKMADRHTSLELMATNSHIKPGGPKYEQLLSNIRQADADISAIDEELERRANFDQYDMQIENAGEQRPATVVRKRATDAVMKVMDDANVPVKQVSQKEADQMMEMFTIVNQDALAGYARQMRPDNMKRYAVINSRDPYAVPKYFEKRRFAREYMLWGNRQGGLFKVLDLEAANSQGDVIKQAASVQPQIDVWHGSGAVFTKFDHSHMGEGAGSQAFGWGTYLTNSRAIGKDYSNITSHGWTFNGKNRREYVAGKNYQEESIRDILLNLDLGYHFAQAVGKVRNFTQSAIRDYEDNYNDLSKADLNDLEDLRNQLSFINSLKETDFERSPKNLYKVAIPDDTGNNYYEWYKAIDQETADSIKSALIKTLNMSEDAPEQKARIEKINRDFDDFVADGEDLGYVYNILQTYLKPDEAKNAPFNGSDKLVSEFLYNLGYVGIKYPAGTLMGGGDGATNYVVFNEDDAKIVEHILFMIDDGAEPVHSIDVTPEMKESVMQGQPMFQKGTGGRIYGWTDGTGIFLTPLGMNPNSLMHEYTHIWDLYIQKHYPKLWKEIVNTLKKTQMWQQVRENPNYRSIWNDDNRMASEVHSRLTGARSEEEFEKAAADPNNKDSADIIRQVKDVLRKFWEKIASLFGYGKDRLEEFVLMPLKDVLNGLNPISGETSTAFAEAMAGKMVERTLMGVHNLSEEKLRKVLKQGGLANPSLAVVDTKNHMHTDYGSISLIPKASLIDARTGRNAGTFTADAWTPTYPTVQKRMSDKGQDKFWKDLRTLREEDGEMANFVRMAFDTWLDKETGQERLAYWYLKDKGMKPEMVRNKNPYGEDIVKRIDELTDNGNLEVSRLSEEQIKEVADMYHAYKESIGEPVTPAEERIKRLQERMNPEKPSPFLKLQQFRLDELAKYGELLHNLNEFEYAVRRSADSDGKPNVEATVNNAQKVVKDQNLQQDFDKWLQDKADSYGIEEWLYNGTDNQGRQKFVRNTLENASRLMKKEGLNGAVNWSSIGNWIAKVANKEKTLAGIRKNRKNLQTSEEEHEAFREKWSQVMYDIATKLGKGDSWSGENIMSDILDHKDYASYLKREYGMELSKEDREAIDTFIKEVQTSYPTGYFETKFERPVYLNEFEVAVVPENTSPDIIEALKNAGLDVRTYDDTGTEDQKDANRTQATMDAVTSRNDILFQIEGGMAGESKPVKSLMREGNLFSDADFQPEPAKAEKGISELSDEDLLELIGKTDEQERRKYIDAYDSRHEAERRAEGDAYADMLEFNNTSLNDAYDMFDSVFAQFNKGGYASTDRTKLMSQIDALERYIEDLEEREAERKLEEQEETDSQAEKQIEAKTSKAQQKYEQQKEQIRQKGYDLTQLKLRPLEEGETCHVERRYVENGMFSFTGKERIESIDDVAYIFKQLEDAAVENTFLVLEKEGVPTIIHLATGLYTASYAKADPALAAYSELQPDKVYFIHNHPSGNLKCSKADEDVLRIMGKIFGNKLQPGIIIDTKSGKYGLFGNTLPISPSTQNKMPEKVEGEVPMKVYSFSKQVFDADWNPETAFDAGTAARVAKFVSSHRLGDHRKTSLLVMTQNWKVTGNVFLPWTTLKEAVTIEGADLIARYMNQMGGTIVTLYGNYDFNDIDSRGYLVRLKNMLDARGVYLADVIHVDNDIHNYKSAREKGMIGEPSPEDNRTASETVPMEQAKNIEDVYADGLTPNDSIDMNKRVNEMSPNQLISEYKRVNADMLDENGLNIDEQEDKFRQEWIDKHGWPPAPGSGFGQATADFFNKQADKYGFNKMALRWDLLDRIEELGLKKYLNSNKLPEKTANIVKMYRHATPEIEKLNNEYNANLTKLINGKLDKGFVFDMGVPSAPLLTTGFPNLPIKMQASVLKTKTHDPAHPYSYSEVYDLVKHIQRPLAIFEYGDKDKAQNLMIGISQNVEDGKQFLVGLSLEPVVNGVKLPYNSVRNVFPKNFHDWIHWIAQGKLLRVDGKKEIQDIIDALRINPVDYIDKNVLNSVAKIVKDFQNPKLSEENLRNIYANLVRAGDDMADMLGGMKVVYESEAPESGTLGWYDPNDNTIHVVLPEHTDANEVKRTVCHEKLGHEGLVALMGDQNEVNKFGQFIFGSASKDLRKRIIEKADEEGYEWNDPLRFSKAAQEVFADIAENGPRTEEEFSLWRKVKHYIIRLLKKMNIRIRGLLNDHDMAYYVLKTGEALKRWNQMTPEAQKEAARQSTPYDIMRSSRRGKPRKRNNESMAQYVQRLREWERWKIAEEQAAANNDPMPDADQINEKWHEQFNRDMAEWKRQNNIEDGNQGLGEFPKRDQGETPQEYAMRVADYETQADTWKNAPSVFDYLQRANDEYREAYKAWKERYGIREEESVDLGLYEGDPERMPHIVDMDDLEADTRADADLAEAVGIDMSSDGARNHTKLAIIERRKNLESANAEDAIWIHDLCKQIADEAKQQGVTPKELREALPDIIEGTYFEDVLKDEHGNIISIEDISDELPIKKTAGLQAILDNIKDWYDEFFHVIEDAGLRNDAGYVEEGYVNHVWSKEKTNPEIWKKYVENFQRTKSPNMRERIFDTYRAGEDIGLVRKFKDIADILAYYSSSNNQAVANKKFLDDLSFIVVEELNGDGEVVNVSPLLNSNKPNIAVADRYKMYHVPGVGDVWVLKEIERSFANIFGTMRTQDIPEWLTKLGKAYDVTSSTAKKIQLSFSAFHMGALTEVAMAQMRPDRALRALGQYIIFDCAKAGTIPAYAHPEDFKFAASHLVQLGATQDYSAADVNNVTEKLREIVRELANSDTSEFKGVVKKAAGLELTPLAAALDYINKGMDKVLWNYLHDGLKIACFKMFAEQIEKRVEKEGLMPEQREQLLDEAGQYVNDTFGGQYWELLNVSPALIKWLRRGFLSPDWLISTQRHFLANFGFGSLYSESGFLNYLRYNADNIKRVFGANIPKDENRRFRSKNAKQCYLLGVCGFFYVMMNAVNALFRAQDEEKEKEKAEQARKDNPEYKSPYELSYPDGMKWYDYTMYGNTIGQQTHLFLGRYDDGTEWYARWGKQFREFPELFMGRHGVEFPTPLMERMSGKANPVGRYLLYDLPLTVGMYGYKQPRETQEIAEKYGNTVALLAMTAKKFLPFSVPTQQDKEFKMFDLVMPSQKGFTQWKAIDYFKTYIQGGDMDGVMRTYNAAVMNGIDAEECLKAAISTVKATQRKEMEDGITDLQSAMEHFDAAKGSKERKRMKRKVIQYLADQNYKTFTRDEALEQVNDFLNGTVEPDNDINKYVELQTSEDVRDDYRLDMVRKQAKKYVDEVKTAEGDRQRKLEDTYQPWIEIDQIIKDANKRINRLKRQLGKDGNDADLMQQIRTIRSEAQTQVDAVKAP